jgi:hypothetical protein
MNGKKKKIIGMVLMITLAAPFPLCAEMSADDAPETVEINAIADIYEPVQFDHAAHVTMVESCSFCHHHTTGSAPEKKTCSKCHKGEEDTGTVACYDCHEAKRFSAQYLSELEQNPLLFHIGKPGLKGAYHQNCIGCHTEIDGPVGCQDCHQRTDKGDKLFHSGKYAPDPKKAHGSGHH